MIIIFKSIWDGLVDNYLEVFDYGYEEGPEDKGV